MTVVSAATPSTSANDWRNACDPCIGGVRSTSRGPRPRCRGARDAPQVPRLLERDRESRRLREPRGARGRVVGAARSAGGGVRGVDGATGEAGPAGQPPGRVALPVRGAEPVVRRALGTGVVVLLDGPVDVPLVRGVAVTGDFAVAEVVESD